ncbi:uroporphyrinogen-III synthase [Trichomonascus vanleenenianus]|uniref:uroporphyrinogen-III synthase HEM4 n=1 Tax=Trichomonascus vanleenenianus TaxID=2268995 RepID=UPI003EC9C8FF
MSNETVLLLKNRSESDLYADLSEDTRYIPLLNHAFTNEEYLNAYLCGDEFKAVQAVIVTSQRAVEALAAQLDRVPDKNIVLNKPIYTVGPATADLLRSHNFKEVYGDDSGNGSILAQVLVRKPHQSYIFFTGETRRDSIPNALNNKEGVSLREIVVYKTVPVDAGDRLKQELRSSVRPWVVFFSPANGETITEVLKQIPRDRYRLAAIGPTTKEFLSEHGFQTEAMAAKPSPESLKNAISSTK